MKNVKEAEIFDELKKMGANNMVKWIDKSIGNNSIWCLNVIEIDNSHVTADDFRKQRNKGVGMNCWHCGTQLIWGGDFDGEDYGVQEEYSIVTNLSCPNCKSYVEVYYPKQNDE